MSGEQTFVIRGARPEDEEWVEPIFDAYSEVLGHFGTAWHRWQSADTERNRWVVIPRVAFAHYLERLDGWNTLYEIGVHENAKRHGFGTRLLHHIGTPMRLKTDAEHPESNLFYERNGFDLVDTSETAKGKPLHIYEREEPFDE